VPLEAPFRAIEAHFGASGLTPGPVDIVSIHKGSAWSQKAYIGSLGHSVWSRGGSPLKARTGDIKAHIGAAEAHLGAVEDHPGAMGANMYAPPRIFICQVEM
jgi:hypothetical protein